ncbi:MAG: ShlB/FhaC/HecB family hemolysin secretion/activation protein, partial [Cyanobacteriota bacterium]
GHTPYSPSQLKAILRGCASANGVTPGSREALKACAAALTARLTTDGYINSRVFITPTPQGEGLEVVEGRIAEIRINNTNPQLTALVRRKLRPLNGSVLHLPTLQRQLLLLKDLRGVDQVRGNLGKLGSDPTQAVLVLSLEARQPRWQGLLELRNDGDGGTGQWRSVATVLKNDLALPGDTFLVYGEADGTSSPELGSWIGSISYTLPLSSSLSFTDSFGISRRQLVEATGIANTFAYRQLQNLAQLEWTFQDTLNDRWYAFAGLSVNRNDGFIAGNSAPIVIGGGADGWLSSGYLRAGIGFSSLRERVSLAGSVYALQGLAGMSPANDLNELTRLGINPGEARALAGQLGLSWGLARTLQLNLRVAGQLAFAPLTSDMTFSVGSNNGLRGLPGTLISGDSGLLGSAELNWTVWQRQQQALQLVPFIGAGAVRSTRNGLTYDDGVGSGGLLGRWIAGRHWSLELGWVEQFSVDNNRGFWNNWLLDSGLYSKLQYRF